MSKAIRLIVGLGNVGASYEGTRHNAGFLFADEAARKFGGFFSPEKKFSGDVCRVKIDGREVFILKPSTFMNLSGIAVAALASFYKILPEEILVVHDELDLPPGSIKLKEGGGTAGHNGLKSITEKLGTPNFVRLRVGIGHPRNKQLSIPVADYVLTRPSPDDRQLIEDAVERGIENTALIASGNLKEAANKLNEKRRVLVSACLLGYPIRYDGSDKKISDELIDRLKNSAEVISACPEMLGGLPCPRLASEQQSHTGKVIASDGRDISVFFRLGAHETLNICKNYGIRVAVLKSKSPSCGKGFIYDGSFTGQLTKGEGITSRLLSENGIKIFNESEVSQAIEKIRGK